MKLVVRAVGNAVLNCGPLGRDVNIVFEYNIITPLLLRRISVSHTSDLNFAQFWFIIHNDIQRNEFGRCKFSLKFAYQPLSGITTARRVDHTGGVQII